MILMRILIYGAGVIGEKSMKNEEYKKLSIKEFTKAAGRYESNHAGIYEMCKKDYPDILEELEKEPFRDLLDAGCGPAPMISLLAEKHPDRHYTGLDLTPAMIEQAKKKNIPNTTFVVGDCENFPFEKDSFDAIICSMSFHHYPDPQAFFDSVKRCLRPNGTIIPAANPASARCSNLLSVFLIKNTHAAPSVVPTNGISIPSKTFISIMYSFLYSQKYFHIVPLLVLTNYHV